MTDDELKAIEAAANAPDEAWRGGSIPSARHDILALIAEVQRLKALGTSCKHRSGTCKWCHGPVGTPRSDHVCESE